MKWLGLEIYWLNHPGLKTKFNLDEFKSRAKERIKAIVGASVDLLTRIGDSYYNGVFP